MTRFCSVFASGQKLYVYSLSAEGEPQLTQLEYANKVEGDGLWHSSIEYVNPDPDYLRRLKLEQAVSGEIWFHEEENEVGQYLSTVELDGLVVFLLEKSLIVHVQPTDATPQPLPNYNENTGFTPQDMAAIFGEVEAQEEKAVASGLDELEKELEEAVKFINSGQQTPAEVGVGDEIIAEIDARLDEIEAQKKPLIVDEEAFFKRLDESIVASLEAQDLAKAAALEAQDQPPKAADI